MPTATGAEAVALSRTAVSRRVRRNAGVRGPGCRQVWVDGVGLLGRRQVRVDGVRLLGPRQVRVVGVGLFGCRQVPVDGAGGLLSGAAVVCLLLSLCDRDRVDGTGNVRQSASIGLRQSASIKVASFNGFDVTIDVGTENL